MNYSESESRLALLQKECFNSESPLYIENLLDLATSINYDIFSSGQLKDTKALKVFVNRYQNVSEIIKESRLSLIDFNVIKTIGEGGFGRIDLVRHKKSKAIYAMKIIEKSTYVRNNFIGFWEERDILVKSDSEWLVKCFYAFMDLKKLYLVMEYMPGGDLYHWIDELEEFSEGQTHFYGMEIALAVEALHNFGYLHRDLKPENMLLDKYGHLKLTDFGTCIPVENGKTKTNFQCGTPDYVAPEILRKSGTADSEVGFETDWWAFGVIMYELYYGVTPFEGDTASEVYGNIMNYKKTLSYPDKEVCKEFKSLLSNILTEPKDRLTIDQLKSHPFFTELTYPWTFKDIRKHPVPITEFNVSGDEDTQYIDYEPSPKQNINSFTTKNNFFTGEHLAFSGFTFNKDYRYEMGMNGVTTDTSELEKKKKQLLTKLEDSENELNERKRKVHELELSVAEKEKIICLKSDELKGTNENYQKLKLKNDKITESILNLEAEKGKLKETLDEKESLLSNLNFEIEHMKAEVDNLNKIKVDSEAEIDQLKIQLKDKSDKVDEMSNMKQLLQTAQSKNEKMKIDLNEKERLLNEAKEHKALLERQIGELNNNRKTEDDSDEIVNIRQCYESLQIEKQQLETRITSMENSMKLSQTEIFDLNEQLNGERFNHESLKSQNNVFEKEIEQLKCNIKDLKQKMSQIEDSNRLLTYRITIAENERDKMEQDKRAAEDLQIMATIQCDELKDQCEEDYLKWDHERRSMTENMHESQNKVKQMKLNLNELEGVNTKLKEQLTEVNKELDEANKEVKEVKSQNSKINQKINEKEKEIEENEKKIEKLKSDLVVESTRFKQLMGCFDKFVKDPTELTTKSKASKKEGSIRKLKEVESKAAKYKDQVNEKQKELDELKNVIQQLQSKNADLEGDNNRKQKCIEELTNKLNHELSAINEYSEKDKSILNDRLETTIFVMANDKRRRVIWEPYNATLEPTFLKLSKLDDSGVIHMLEIHNMGFIRDVSEADNIRIKAALIPLILQIAYAPDVSPESTGITDNRKISVRASVVKKTLDRQDGSNYSMDSSWRGSNSDLTQIQYIPYNGHQFLEVQFRTATTCNFCHTNCSDLINPPPAYECRQCKIRIHGRHLNENAKLMACMHGYKWMYLKFISMDNKIKWRNHINKLKDLQNKQSKMGSSPNLLNISSNASFKY